MSADDITRAIYLLLLLGALIGWGLVESRGRFGQVTRQALAWVMIFGALAAGYGLYQSYDFSRQQIMTGTSAGEALVLKRNRDGHYYLTLSIGGTDVRFMVDTGASSIVLSDRDTDRLKIDRSTLAFLGRANTANGSIRTALVTLRNVKMEGRVFGDLPAQVGDGPLSVSLLGMDFLKRFARVEISGDRMVLTP